MDLVLGLSFRNFTNTEEEPSLCNQVASQKVWLQGQVQPEQ